MKTLRLVTESGKHIYDVEVNDDVEVMPGAKIFQGTDVWEVVDQRIYTNHPNNKRQGVEYVVIP